MLALRTIESELMWEGVLVDVLVRDTYDPQRYIPLADYITLNAKKMLKKEES